MSFVHPSRRGEAAYDRKLVMFPTFMSLSDGKYSAPATSVPFPRVAEDLLFLGWLFGRFFN